MTRTPTAALAALALLAPAPALAQAQGTLPGVGSENYQEVPVGGYVPATLRLTIGAPATFGEFAPGVTQDYTATMAGRVTSTAGDAVLSVADPSSIATGRLVNGTLSLVQPLQAQASNPSGIGGGPLTPVGGSDGPTTLLSYGGPVSNDPVTIVFKQSIDAGEPLRTGAYSKTLTFTLSATQP